MCMVCGICVCVVYMNVYGVRYVCVCGVYECVWCAVCVCVVYMNVYMVCGMCVCGV